MATLRNRRKPAAVLTETPEKTRINQSRSANDPEGAQEHISQVSEEIEGRVTKKFSKKSVGQSLVSWVPCQNLTSFF